MHEVCLNEKSYKRLSEYADTCGVSLDQAASKIINKWMEETGDYTIYVIQKRRANPSLKPGKSYTEESPHSIQRVRIAG